MPRIILFSILALPLVTAWMYLFLHKRGHPAVARVVAMIGILVNGFLAMMYVSAGNSAAAVCLFTHPVAGQMCIAMESSAARLIALMCFLLSILIATQTKAQGWTPVQDFFVFSSASVAWLALLSTNFLLRYIALELTATCLFVDLIRVYRDRKMVGSQAISAFINLRIGDLGLLIAIFLLYFACGSFNIPESLRSAELLDKNKFLITLAGLLLAVWVKMGAWPLNWWVRITQTTNSVLHTWFSRTLFPTLGAYLLYKVTPAIIIYPYWADLFYATAALSVFISSFTLVSQKESTNPLIIYQSISASLLICLAATGIQKEILPAMAALLIVRVLGDVADRMTATQKESDKPLYLIVHCFPRFMEMFLAVWMLLGILNGTRALFSDTLLWASCCWMLYFSLQRLGDALPESGRRFKIKKMLLPIALVAAGGFGSLIIYRAVRVWMYPAAVFLDLNFLEMDGENIRHLVLGSGIACLTLIFMHTSQYASRFCDLVNKYVKRNAVIVFAWAKRKFEFKDFLDQYQSFKIFFQKGIHFLYYKVEKFTSEQVLQFLKGAVYFFAGRLKRLHTGMLRLNLIWIPVLLVVLLCLYLVSGMTMSQT